MEGGLRNAFKRFIGRAHAPDERPRVFLSSVFYELTALRSRVAAALEAAGYGVILGEAIRGGSNAPYEECAARVRTCDAMILLVGSYSGTFVPTIDVSITEHEYRVASLQRIPIIPIRLTGDLDPGPPDRDSLHLERQQGFLEELSWSRTLAYDPPSTESELISIAITELAVIFDETREPAPEPAYEALPISEIRRAALESNPLKIVIAETRGMSAERVDVRTDPTARKLHLISSYERHGLSIVWANALPPQPPANPLEFRRSFVSDTIRPDVLIMLVSRWDNFDRLMELIRSTPSVVLWIPDLIQWRDEALHDEIDELVHVTVRHYSSNDRDTCNLARMLQNQCLDMLEMHSAKLLTGVAAS